MPHIVEMRMYKTKPGKRAEFIAMFLEKQLPAHKEIGMKVLGPFPAIDDPDMLFMLRAFPDLASRDEMKSRFYDGPLWKELEPVVMPLLEKYDVVLVEDTANLFGP